MAREGVAFDRGMFTASVNGHPLRWAFMPPYLNTLTMPERELAARRGWMLTERTIAEMQEVSRGIGANFVVMFLPFKSQVYLPWLAQSPESERLANDLQFYLPDNPGTPDVDGDAAQPPRPEPADAAILRRARHSSARHHRRADGAISRRATTSTSPTSLT